MRNSLRIAFAFIFVLAAAAANAHAQTAGADQAPNTQTVVETNAEAGGAASSPEATAPAPQNDSPYRRKRGDNEFGFWGGGAFNAFTAFGGITEAEASDRRFVIAAFRYGRTIATNDTVALQYTLDVIPLALATGNIVGSTTVGGVTTFQRQTTYGGGLTPLGLQLDFRNRSKVKPFIHVNGGLLVFTDSFPLPDSGKLGLVGETGAGLRVFTSEKRAVSFGVRFHHISNGDTSGANRGLNQFIFYAGFSVFK